MRQAMVYSRDTDYEHFVKCGNCGWEGWSAQMRHGYEGYGNSPDTYDVEPMDYCPVCDSSEIDAVLFLTCIRDCNKCEDRFLCWTGLKRIPVHNVALQIISSEVKHG